MLLKPPQCTDSPLPPPEGIIHPKMPVMLKLRNSGLDFEGLLD